jgi:prophage endopeptidase
MSRTEFVLATAIILFVAFCLGWFANWLLHRFTRVAADDVAQLDRMSQDLHEAEEMRAYIEHEAARTSGGGEVFSSKR